MAKSVSLYGDLVSDVCPRVRRTHKLSVETKVWSELHNRCQNEKSSDMISGNVMFLETAGTRLTQLLTAGLIYSGVDSS